MSASNDTAHESLGARLRRWVLGVAWAMKPPRTRGVPATLAMVASHCLGLRKRDGELPDPQSALTHPDGLVGICKDMSVAALMRAYAKGLFPFCHVEPMKWWAPRERMALRLENFHIEKNLRRLLRNKRYRVTFDQAFDAVMQGCAEARPGRWQLTWITPRVMQAYRRLFDAGHAHSVEVWDEESNLAGGLYGVAVGKVFFTESQFVRGRDASKVGFATLNCHLQLWGFVMNDGKFRTGHLANLGFRLMPREAFNLVLAGHCAEPGRVGRWSVDPSLDVAAWEPAAAKSSTAA